MQLPPNMMMLALTKFLESLGAEVVEIAAESHQAEIDSFVAAAKAPGHGLHKIGYRSAAGVLVLAVVPKQENALKSP